MREIALSRLVRADVYEYGGLPLEVIDGLTTG